jgi:hypothetical protein
MLRCKHEFNSNSRQPDFTIRRTHLVKTKVVLTSQLASSLVCAVRVGPKCGVDQVIANAIVGRSLITLPTSKIQGIRPVESGKTLNHFHEPSSQARCRDRGIEWIRLRPLSLRVPPLKKRFALPWCVGRIEDKNVITHRSPRFDRAMR